MSKPRAYEVRLARTAQRDILAIMQWSLREFGDRAALRYDMLLKHALMDIGEDPDRPGSKERPDILIAGARTYHLAFSRSRVKGTAVKTPRHFLLYRRAGENIIEVGRVLHDTRDLARHLPGAYRRSEAEE